MELYRAQLGAGSSSHEGSATSVGSSSSGIGSNEGTIIVSSSECSSDLPLDSRLATHPTKELNEEKRRSARRKECVHLHVII